MGDVPQSSRRPDRSPTTGIRFGWLWPTLVTLLVTLTGIDQAQLWRDELASWSAATRGLDGLVRMVGTIDAVTGAWYLLLHWWVAVFGDSVTALRLPAALALSAAAGLTTVLGERLVGARAGLLAGLLFAVLPGTSRYGQEARPYALATLLAVLATVLLVDAVRRGGWVRWVGYAATVAALGLAHLVALILVGAHAVVVLTEGPSGGRVRRFGAWSAALVPAALLLTPLVLVAREQRSRQLDWVDPARLTDVTGLPGGLAQSATVGGLVLGLAALGALRYGRPALVPGVCLALPVLLLLAVGSVVPLWVPRYLFFTVPFGCLLAGAALTLTRAARADAAPPPVTTDSDTPGTRPDRGTPQSGRLRRVWVPVRGAGLPAGLAVVALVGLMGLPDQVALRRTHEWPRSAAIDYRGAAEVVVAGRRPGDAVVYAPRDGWLFLDLGMAYHLGRSRPPTGRAEPGDAPAGPSPAADQPRDALLIRDQADRGDLWATECARPAECLAGVTRVWLVVAGRRDDPLAAVPGAKGDALRADYTVTGVWPRAGLTVALLTR